jgi:hypothetical protein
VIAFYGRCRRTDWSDEGRQTLLMDGREKPPRSTPSFHLRCSFNGEVSVQVETVLRQRFRISALCFAGRDGLACISAKSCK